MNLIFFWAGLLSLIASSGLALWVGRAQSRAGALVLVGGLLVSTILTRVLKNLGVSHVAPLIDLACSLGMGVGMLWLALRHSSLWLAVAMLLEGAEFGVTGYFVSSPAQTLAAYNTYLSSLNTVDFLIVANLLVGTFLDWRRGQRPDGGDAYVRADPAVS